MKFSKILFILFVVCCVCAALSIGAFGLEYLPTELSSEDSAPLYPDNKFATESSSPAEDFIQDDFVPASSPAEDFIQDDFVTASSPTEDFIQDDFTVSEIRNYVSNPVIVDTVAPITPSNTNGFQSIILGLLGNYSPVVIEYAYTNTSGYISYLREVQPDYSWMCGAAIFLVVLYSLFRLIGALIKR